MTSIEDPITLPCGAILKNRVCKAAMTEGLADEYARATDKHVQLYSTWGNSGCGLLITGNIQIDRRFLERPGNVCIDGEQDEASLIALKKYAKAATENGSHCWVQIAHAGRQAYPFVAKKAPAPSAVKVDFLIPLPEPYEMSIESIRNTVQKFGHAAKVVKEVGFTGLQIHAAHGYPISSFLNPRANRRTDEYGGSLENRARLLLEVIREVRAAVGERFPISVKLNSSDFQKGGFTHEDAVKVASWLDAEGIDLLEISGGNYENPSMMTGPDGSGERDTQASSTQLREAYFLVYARDIRNAMKNTPLMVTGGFRSRNVMNKALFEEELDVIGIGRPLCVDTNCVLDLLNRRIERLPAPEFEWKFPGFINVARYLALGKLLYIGSSLMAHYGNIYRLGDGLDPLTKPNLFFELIRTNRLEMAKATGLKGLPENDPHLVKRRGPNVPMIVGVVVLLVAIMMGIFKLLKRVITGK